MRHEAAIVENNDDIERVVEEIATAYQACTKVEIQETQIREAANERRLHLGRLLNQARERWPRSGPRAKGWGELLKRAKIDDVTAWRYMKFAGATEEIPFTSSNEKENSGSPRTYADAGLDNRPRDGASHQGHAQPTNQIAPVDPKLDESVQSEGEDEDETANPYGGSGEPDRGSWCTPKWITDAIGPVNVDPFSNLRSTVQADVSCMLERGDNGLVTAELGGEPGVWSCKASGVGKATSETKVWIQPPYERGFVLQAVRHYLHTRFIALLRLSPDTEWFRQLFARSELVLPFRDRVDFQPPRGVFPEGKEAPGALFPHALFYARAEDATPAIRALCFEWTTNNKKAI